jgi:hypothetical protein
MPYIVAMYTPDSRKRLPESRGAEQLLNEFKSQLKYGSADFCVDVRTPLLLVGLLSLAACLRA